MAVPASSSRSAFLESLSFETVALRYLPSNVLCCNSLIVFVGCNPLLWRCQFRAIVIHSLLLLILSLLDRRFIYLCHLFHSTPHVFFIVLLFVFLVFLFLFYNYQHAKARFYNDSPQRFSYKFYPSCEFCSNHGISRQIEKGEFFFPQTCKEAGRLWVLPSSDAFKGNHFPCGKPSVYSFCNCYTNAGFFQAEHNPLGEKREASRLGSPPETRLYNYSCLDSLKMFEN